MTWSANANILRGSMADNESTSKWNPKGGAATLYTCHKFDCDFTTYEKLPKCPECGFPLYDAATFKVFGVLLAVCGVFLAAVGIGIIVLLTFREMKSEFGAVVIYGLLSALALAGIALIAGGLRQAVTGLKSTSFLALFVILLLAIGILAAVLRFVAGSF